MLQSANQNLTHDTASSRIKLIDFISDDDCDCSISWHHSVNAAEQHRKLLEVDSFKRWPKRVLLFKTLEIRDILGLQKMIMVRKNGKLKKKYFVTILLLSW